MSPKVTGSRRFKLVVCGGDVPWLAYRNWLLEYTFTLFSIALTERCEMCSFSLWCFHAKYITYHCWEKSFNSLEAPTVTRPFKESYLSFFPMGIFTEFSSPSEIA